MNIKRKIALIFLFAAISLTPAQTVVINEIAWMGTQASYADEWIELYNLTSDSISLEGWKLRAVDGSPNIFLHGHIGGYHYFVLERTDDRTIADYPAQQIYTGNLGNDGEHLILEDGSGAIIDQVNCSAGWFAGQNSPDKFTMEKKHPGAPSSSADSWGQNDGLTKNGMDAAGNLINGTPGAKNSLYVATRVGSDHSSLPTLYFVNTFPNPFRSQTTIWMSCLQKPAQPLRLSIYDLRGRLIKAIAMDNNPGHYYFLWDGCDRNGSSVPAGIYFARIVGGKDEICTRAMLKMK